MRARHRRTCLDNPTFNVPRRRRKSGEQCLLWLFLYAKYPNTLRHGWESEANTRNFLKYRETPVALQNASMLPRPAPCSYYDSHHVQRILLACHSIDLWPRTERSPNSVQLNHCWLLRRFTGALAVRTFSRELYCWQEVGTLQHNGMFPES